MATGSRMTGAEVDQRFGPLPYTDLGNGKVKVDPSWIAANIVAVQLFDGKQVQLHKAVAAEFAKAYQAAVQSSGYHPRQVQTFVTRHINWDARKPLSNHSYGIAVDFDPSANPRGAKLGKLDATPAFVQAFEAAGWVWGGKWRAATRDAMHFERTSRKPVAV